ncbi:MAG: Mycothiol acetyltransferase [Deltaproteobacteria bacterium ADurb.Bin151]|mgnify:CR=1 FL=1|nr:MAG: Mycothiol acetyltransferase [Deltaproteobacteria bacterium ADurb.Bin151]
MINGNDLEVTLSPLEEIRFGIKTARAANLTLNNLFQVIEFCQNHAVRLLIARCHAHEIDVVQEMERIGFTLTDTLVYYVRNLKNVPLPQLAPSIEIRPMMISENDQVQNIAAEAFSNYISHYHADARLNRSLCDETYKDWARNACNHRDDTHDVLVALREGRILAFATLQMNDRRQGEGVLFGVSPSSQGSGLYKALMTAGMHWCAEAHAQEMIVSTQIINIAVQKVWSRLGFEPRNYVYTFHKWFEV